MHRFTTWAFSVPLSCLLQAQRSNSVRHMVLSYWLLLWQWLCGVRHACRRKRSCFHLTRCSHGLFPIDLYISSSELSVESIPRRWLIRTRYPKDRLILKSLVSCRSPSCLCNPAQFLTSGRVALVSDPNYGTSSSQHLEQVGEHSA